MPSSVQTKLKGSWRSRLPRAGASGGKPGSPMPDSHRCYDFPKFNRGGPMRGTWITAAAVLLAGCAGVGQQDGPYYRGTEVYTGKPSSELLLPTAEACANMRNTAIARAPVSERDAVAKNIACTSTSIATTLPYRVIFRTPAGVLLELHTATMVLCQRFQAGVLTMVEPCALKTALPKGSCSS